MLYLRYIFYKINVLRFNLLRGYDYLNDNLFRPFLNGIKKMALLIWRLSIIDKTTLAILWFIALFYICMHIYTNNKLDKSAYDFLYGLMGYLESFIKWISLLRFAQFIHYRGTPIAKGIVRHYQNEIKVFEEYGTLKNVGPYTNHLEDHSDEETENEQIYADYIQYVRHDSSMRYDVFAARWRESKQIREKRKR